jgi:hypothetical protein
MLNYPRVNLVHIPYISIGDYLLFMPWKVELKTYWSRWGAWGAE